MAGKASSPKMSFLTTKGGFKLVSKLRKLWLRIKKYRLSNLQLISKTYRPTLIKKRTKISNHLQSREYLLSNLSQILRTLTPTCKWRLPSRKGKFRIKIYNDQLLSEKALNYSLYFISSSSLGTSSKAKSDRARASQKAMLYPAWHGRGMTLAVIRMTWHWSQHLIPATWNKTKLIPTIYHWKF